MASSVLSNDKSDAPDSVHAYSMSQIPPELQLVAPALLQLNRGAGSEVQQHQRSAGTYDSCPSTSCPTIPVLPLPNCTDCQATATSACFNQHCITCLQDCRSHCASPCDEGDDCSIAQPCYDERCSPEACPDVACPTEPCGGAFCSETLHCDSCFDDGCAQLPSNSQTSAFDPQLCAQGQCYGFLPRTPGFLDFTQGHSLHDHFGQYSPDLSSVWSQQAPTPFHHKATNGFANHEHVGSSIHHKRQKTDCSDISQSSHNSYGFPAPSTFHDPWQPDLNHGFENIQVNQPGQGFDSSTWESSQFNFFPTTPAPSYVQSPDQLSPTFGNLNSITNSDALEGIICGLNHIGSSVDALDPAFQHSPFCTSTRKRTRQAPNLQLKPLQTAPVTRALPTPSSSNQSPIEPTLFSPALDKFKSEFNDASTDFTCKWIVGTNQDGQAPSICSQSFASSKELDEHVQSEHTNKLGSQHFACRWLGCDTTFKHRGKLNRHVSGTHSRYHAYGCSHCERTFCTKEQLKNHETTHTGERRYKCSFCDHTSATKTQHNTHERTHTGAKPFSCPYCSHRSGDSSNLSKHVKSKHPGLPASRQRATKAAT